MRDEVIRYAGVVVIATVMAMVGSVVMRGFGHGYVGLFDFCTPSILLWTWLAWRIRGRSLGTALLLGAISPVLGSLWFGPFALWISPVLTPVPDTGMRLGWFTSPVGMVTGLLVWMWCRPRPLWRVHPSRHSTLEPDLRDELLSTSQPAALA